VNLGSAELLIIAVVVILLFGATWLPKAARNLGRAKVELDKTQRQINEAKQQVVDATGLDKAEATIRKANKALNQSPQKLIKGAATGALLPTGTPAEPAVAEASDDAETTTVAEASDDAETTTVAEATDHADAEEPDSEPSAKETEETVNVNWSAADPDQ